MTPSSLSENTTNATKAATSTTMACVPSHMVKSTQGLPFVVGYQGVDGSVGQAALGVDGVVGFTFVGNEHAVSVGSEGQHVGKGTCFHG